MILSTQISRLDGLSLCASVNDDPKLGEVKSQVKQVLRTLTRNSEPQASIDSGSYSVHYLIENNIIFLTITDAAFPRKIAFTFLADIAREFTTTYTVAQLSSPSLRPYAFMEFDTFISRTGDTYSDARATQNLDAINEALKDVTNVMHKNIEDLLYRGDSLDKMGELSARLRDDSKKYRRAAVRINWELLIKQYAPFAGLGLIILLFVYFRFL